MPKEEKQTKMPSSVPTKPFRGPGGGHGPRFQFEKVEIKDPLGTLKKLLRYLGRYKWRIIFAFFLVMLSSILGIIGPYLIGKGIDNYIVPKKFDGFLNFLLILGSVYVLGVVFTWVQSYVMLITIQKLAYSLRNDVFDKLHLLPLKFFDTRSHGDIMSRIVNDIDNIGMVLGNSVIQLFSSIITLVGIIIMMLRINVLMTFISLITIPLTIFTTRLISKRTRDYFYQNQTLLGNLNGIIEEDISGIKVIKIFGREEKEIDRFERINQQMAEIGIRAQIFSGVIGPLMNLLNNISFAIIAGFGGIFAYRNLISIGAITVFINYSRQFTRPINELANQYNMIQSAIASAERVFEILDEEEEKKDDINAIELNEIKGEVEFRNVWFYYVKDIPVLKNINFHVYPGQVIALVGPTGAGKTTIASLIARFYDVDMGEILIDGIDIRDIKKKSLRSNLGIVLQDTYLFNATVRENIRYGRLDANDEEIERAAKLAHAEPFIRSLPQGYNTLLSEDGGDLSQGQRQLIAIARAILADPKILILDEATSNVDTRTERYIQEAMLNLMRERTSFVIAHRLSTVKNANLILVINNGEIIESGTHKELIKEKGFYYNLYMSQFIEEEIEVG
ncbi:MAG TPA: ABC transporter ATP-binding protein [Dictyoglomaceae bacterium]|nr:ABC transporter ATP-binding protein [Dictyoglomaceae bacterium]HOL39948.1 ABC transporter ATP-binding protein [Dictyoglomaceae bacterium]HPP16410.1 ABC transporter ATP-binding protein [Dictyoglomaceae bacterium]